MVSETALNFFSKYGVVDGTTYYDVKLTFKSGLSYCLVCDENVEMQQNSL